MAARKEGATLEGAVSRPAVQANVAEPEGQIVAFAGLDLIRREALVQAVLFSRGRGHSEADVVANAIDFEAYLRNGAS